MDNEIFLRYLDDNKLVKQYPAKRSRKMLVLQYLHSKLNYNKTYNERELTQILNEWHTFNDGVSLRRDLYDFEFIDRARDGSKYWKLKKEIK